jgi:adenosine kinase
LSHKGAQGAEIYTEGKCIAIPPVPAAKVIDPTGCGDAFRGGLLFGLENGYRFGNYWATS